MCGIVGFSWEDDVLLKEMMEKIHHRGPDQDGFYLDKKMSLGHLRLSIIDLSENGRQPIFNEDKSIVIIYNGEIYNFQEIKKRLENKGHRFMSLTDTEVIVHAYEEYGTKSFALFDGVFAFALYDIKKEQLYLVRDRYGIKPLYYTIFNSKIAFSSEIKAMLCCSAIKKEIDTQSLSEFLTFRYVPSPKTILKNIYQIPIGHYLLYHDKKTKIERYANLYDKIEIKKPEEEFRNLFLNTVSSQMVADVPVGVFLSGGLDSGTIVAAMSKVKDNIKTFSVGYDIEDFKDDELEKAKRTSDYYSTDHKEVLLNFNPLKLLPKVMWHMDEPISDPASLALYLLSKEAKKKVTVVLSGDGADETLGGYEHYKMLLTTKKISPYLLSKKLFIGIINKTPKPILNRFFKYTSSLGEKGLERFSKYITEFGDPANDYLNLNAIFTEEEKKNILNSRETVLKLDLKKHMTDNKYSLNNFLKTDINTFMQHLLLKVDKMTMAHNLECRVPYLDNNIVNFAFSLPQDYKIRGNTEKYIVRAALKKDLPEFLVKRKKQRFFVPIHYWFKEYNNEFRDLLSKEKIKEQGLFNYQFIKKTIDEFNHSPLYNGRQIWNLSTFMSWYNVFMKEDFKD